MARTRKSIRVVPSAARLIRSLRDIGYQTPEAVADLIDNSVAAKAHNVYITVRWDGAESWIRIVDDGQGMAGKEITEAMRYGSARAYDEEDLGKFGLGLKTASLSQCRRLTVASRATRSSRMEVRQLDLDYIEEIDDWEVHALTAAERPGPVAEGLTKRGTVVLWEDLDRILTYSDPGGGWAERHLKVLAEQIENHVAMVFHRFLQGEVRGRRLRMTINGTPIEPWDPYARDEAKTKALKKREYEISTPYGSGIVELEPFVLPPKSAFSSPTAWARMSGPNDWNRQQGLYIYRANRLIQAGTWSRLRAMDEHTKLARIALSFPTELDAAFGINVAKMRVSLPPELRQQLESDVSAAAVAARKIYDAKPDIPKAGRGASRPTGRGGTGVPTDPVPPSADGGPAEPAASTGAADGGVSADGSRRQLRRTALQQAAERVGEQEALRRIIDVLTERDEEIASELGF
jgi:Histidine kinase-, DNA gyrase B-, and HSP90-like ATPase